MEKKKVRIGINGFGRIGRIVARIIGNSKNMELAAINSRADSSSHAYLLKYDSTYGVYKLPVEAGKNYISLNGKKVAVLNFPSPGKIPWHKYNVDLVIDSTGVFKTSIDLKGHLGKTVKFAILSAPAKDSTKTVVLGVNQKDFNPKTDKIISNSSCTTNCLATVVKVLERDFGIKRAFMTTTHAVTDSQNLLDNSHKKSTRLRRSAISSIIPASTGSAKDIIKLYPNLKDKIICQALRIPLPTVSLINLTTLLDKKVNVDRINKAFIKASHSYLQGILGVAEDKLVSSDLKGSLYSAVVDPFLTSVLNESFVNIYAWYDNEWGYAQRLVDLCLYISHKAKIL